MSPSILMLCLFCLQVDPRVSSVVTGAGKRGGGKGSPGQDCQGKWEEDDSLTTQETHQHT